jgi:Transglutaminase-like superfamily
MLNRKLWIAIVWGVLATASFAQADLVQVVNQDLFMSYLSNTSQDRYQKAFESLGVHKAPPMLSEDEQNQLRPAANILWNREYELRRLPKMIKALQAQKPQDSAKIAKEQKELLNQPALLTKAKDIYNKRVDDIAMERTVAAFAKMPSTNPQVAVCSDVQSADKSAQKPAPSDSISSLASDTATIVQKDARVEQVNDTHSKDWTDASSKLPSGKDVDQSVAKLSTVAAPLLGDQVVKAPVAPTSAPIPAPVPASIQKIDLDKSAAHLDIQNSQFLLQGTAPAPNTAVSIVVRGADGTPVMKDQEPTVTSDANGHFEIPAYIRSGSGDYTVDVVYHQPGTPPSSLSGLVKSVTMTNKDQANPEYLLPSGVIQSDSSEIISRANQIIADAHATTDMEKAKAIHDWVASNITYDTETLKKLEGTGGEMTSAIAPMSSLSVLESKTGICYGYSELYAALGRAAGLQTRMVKGNVKGWTLEHEWNEVFVDGRWVTVDTTWDAGKTPNEHYFDPSADVLAQDHTKLESSVL